MKTSTKAYEKNKQIVYTNDKFVYQDSIYRIWSFGASLIDEKYYSSNKPIALKKKDMILKRRNYSLHRFFELKFAPEEYLLQEGYKLIN